MIQKLFIILVLLIIVFQPQIIHADNLEYIEIFDPQQNKVVRTIGINKEINDMVVNWINKIDGIYPAMNPIKDDGYAIRFPLDPAIKVKNKWLNTTIEEVYLIIPEKEPPFLIIFESENTPMFFLFPGEIAELSNILNFKLK